MSGGDVVLEGFLPGGRVAAWAALGLASLLSIGVLGGTTHFAAASPAEDVERGDRIESAGTVIIGGGACQLIALDDGRFVALQSGAIPKAPLPVKARIRIMAEPAEVQECAHAQSVFVKEFHRLPDLVERSSSPP